MGLVAIRLTNTVKPTPVGPQPHGTTGVAGESAGIPLSRREKGCRNFPAATAKMAVGCTLSVQNSVFLIRFLALFPLVFGMAFALQVLCLRGVETFFVARKM